MEECFPLEEEKLNPNTIYIAYTEFCSLVLMLRWMLLLNHGIITQSQATENFLPTSFLVLCNRIYTTLDCPYKPSDTDSNEAVSVPQK